MRLSIILGMKKFVALVISTLFVCVAITTPALGAVKAGTPCTKAGTTSTLQGKKYTCIKSGKKLTWNAGVVITKPAVQPSPTPTEGIKVEPASATLGGACNGFEGKNFTASSGELLVCKVESDGNTHWASKVDPSNTESTKPSPSTTVESNQLVQSLSPINDCKISDQRSHRSQPNNVGFPITPQEIPITGTTKAIFLPVDFIDAPGVGDPSVRSLAIAEKMKSWFTHFSNGKFNIEAQHSRSWFHSSLRSAAFPNIHPLSTGSNESASLANSLAQDWIDLSGSTFDFNGVTTIFFEFPESVKGFGDGTQGRNITLKTKQGNIQVMFNIMGDSWFTEGFMGVSNKFRADHFWSFYIHEMFHSMGLAQHAPGNGKPLSIGTNQTGTPEGFAGVLDPWELFLLGWLNDEQIFCASKSALNSSTLELTPLDVNRSGTKTAIVQISNHQALVISSRRSAEWSAELPAGANGILIYEVDTTLDRNEDALQADVNGSDNGNNPAYSKWAFYLLPDGVPGGYSIRRGLTDFILKKGQAVTFEGVSVIYLSDGLNDTIRISKSN